MRIAVLNWSDRRFGGTGSYLSHLIPALRQFGHHVSLWHEVSRPSGHPAICDASDVPAWSVSAMGLPAAIEALARWQPDVLYAHGLLDPGVEATALDVAPGVFFAHDYYGACISGHKSFAMPEVSPCDRRFGWGCLTQYYPRRCGGVSPVTMARAFRRQHRRRRLLSRYAAIVTHSNHMRQEYIGLGIAPSRVINVRYGTLVGATDHRGLRVESRRPSRLLFVGRMDHLKGGAELLLALARASTRLGRRLRLTLAGDGPERTRWEELAVATRRDADVNVRFAGWLDPGALGSAYATADLLAVPSLWPEPLGLVGLEASAYALPAVAFDVGGISDWLRHGENGFLAPGAPPTVSGLADAIVTALEDPARYQRLRDGARDMSSQFRLEHHLRLLTRALERAAE